MKKLVIMLHGVGSYGADLESIARYWQKGVTDLEFASPNAPFHFMNSPDAFQWFSISEINQENRFQRIVEARVAFDQTITTILQQHQMQNHLDQVVFCGFSQGAIMALDAVVSGRWPVAGVIGLSGRLVTPILDGVSKSTQILLMHGEADTVISVQESHLAREQLSLAGFNVHLETFAGLPHAVNQQELERGEMFLKTILGT